MVSPRDRVCVLSVECWGACGGVRVRWTDLPSGAKEPILPGATGMEQKASVPSSHPAPCSQNGCFQPTLETFTLA